MAETVACYSGCRYAERPQAFVWQGEWLQVTAVLKSWHSPHGFHFTVKTQEQRTFELTYDEAADCWEVLPG